MREGEGAVIDALAGVEGFDGVEQEDVGEVAIEGFETRFEDIGGVVVGGNEDDGSLGSWLLAKQWITGRN